ncbi:hypothetical protein L6164_016775 [Bauhinia variegata]|uniref:Uncharacterized protein n=1 Tax=Bauhinia variegata TaxID=167791 RepID=A0ACB9NAW0_BAUVA|nr:hypothetical protein L6164_016775 [Bauhinia variegata]
MLLPFSMPTIFELIRKQHWSKLKPFLGVTKPVIILEELLNSGVDSEIVLRFFQWSRKELRLSYDLEITSKILHFLVNAKRYSKVRSILDDFVKNEKHTVSSIFHTLLLGGGRSSVNALIVDMLTLAYVRNLELCSAYEAFKRAQDYGFKLSINSCGMMEEAFALRNSMLDEGIFPDVSTYNCLIAGLCRNENIRVAKELLNEMEDKGLRADLITYNILIGGWCKLKESRQAEKLLTEMFNMGVKPNHVTYNTLMHGYCMEGNLKAALNVRTQMETGGKRANVVTYNVLIKGFCEMGKLEVANDLLNEMLEKGLVPNRTTYDIIRVEMMEKGFIPDIEGHLCSFSGMC